MALLSYFETGTGGALNPKLPPRIRGAYRELLKCEGKGSTRVVVSFLKRLSQGTINVTHFGLGVGSYGPTYLSEGVQICGAQYDAPLARQSDVNCHWCRKPDELPLYVRVNLFGSLQSYTQKSPEAATKVQAILGLHPSQISHLVCD